MPLFNEWCECEANEDGRKRLLKYTERQDGRAAIARRLPDLVRSHYDDMRRVAEDIAALGVGVVCGRGRNPTLRLWPTIFSGKIDVLPSKRRDMGQQIGQ